MNFSSPVFIYIFMPVFFLIYYIAGDKYKNYVLITASFLFYAWGAPSFILVLLASVLVDWKIGNLIHQNRHVDIIKKHYLALSLIMNIGMLLYFKYFNFFIDNINGLFQQVYLGKANWVAAIMPVGLSFIVFQKISYIVDIVQSRVNPPSRFSIYLLYIFLFPKLLAGPIVKYHHIADQLIAREHNLDDVIYGLYRFSIGLGKKVLIADTLGQIANAIFQIPASEVSFSYAWMGIISYTFQIYFDFSGYADMAVGLARMMGIRIMENFNQPYIAQSFTDFWRRWHISLSGWMRDYLYIPLGGNRCSKLRNYFNLWFVFLVSGLWHGANWTFVVWGIYHGLFLVMDKMFWLEKARRLSKHLNTLLTFFLVMIGWVFFRSNDLGYAVDFLVRLFDLSRINVVESPHAVLMTASYKVVLAIAILISFLPAVKFFSSFLERHQDLFEKTLFKMVIMTALFTLSMMKISASTFSTFIYFRF